MIDELIEEKIITEKVLAQSGYSSYEPINYQTFDFKPEGEMSNIIKESDILITHAGVGTITTALQLRKKVVVMPRLKQYGEHVDDHQIEIAEAYYQKGYIALANNKEKLVDILKNIKNINFQEYNPEPSTIVSSIEQYLDEL